MGKKTEVKKSDNEKNKYRDDDKDEEESKDGGPKEDGVTDVNDVRPILGLCCINTSLYTLWPQCLGGYGNIACTCFETEFKCCKVSERPEDICILSSVGCICVRPATILKGVLQL
jgi:hypothetical protein